MVVSTRGRYALRVLIDLAERGDDALVPMKHVAEKHNISLKYLEQILPLLTRNGLVEGVQGKGGGYRLNRAPADISVYDILQLTEVDLTPVACLAEGADDCPLRPECRTFPMWNELNTLLVDFFTGVTVADLMRKPGQGSPEGGGSAA